MDARENGQRTADRCFPVCDKENMSIYAYPEVLVETEWVKDHLNHRGIKIIEIGLNTHAHEAGHIPGAIPMNWRVDLQDSVQRDFIGREEFARFVAGVGIEPSDTVVFYGDQSNWFAAYGFWLFKYFGHRDARLMNGGRLKWFNEEDRPIVVNDTLLKPGLYQVDGVDAFIHANINDVLEAGQKGTHNLIDTRVVDEFSGRMIVPPGLNEGAMRAGHIPGAVNITWNQVVRTDGTFKSADELHALVVEQKGLDPRKPAITYCRIGERACLTWFVLKYLLGFEKVANYYGGWVEYGNMIGLPIEISANGVTMEDASVMV
jgi:thiosulfate/3-mercaptopyruvate sulfurtransferase